MLRCCERPFGSAKLFTSPRRLFACIVPEGFITLARASSRATRGRGDAREGDDANVETRTDIVSARASTRGRSADERARVCGGDRRAMPPRVLF